MQKISILLALCYVFTLGCAQFERRQQQQVEKRPVIVLDRDQGNDPSDFESPIENKKDPRKVVLVLGPGAARTLAYPSIIKVLVQKNIPIHKVVGIEWGALTAGLYSLNSKPHEVEWKLYKLDTSSINEMSFFSKNLAAVSKFDAYLKENLNGKSTIPFECPTQSLDKSDHRYADKSPELWLQVRDCLAVPGSLRPVGSIVPFYTAQVDMAKKLRAEGYNTLIYLSVIGDVFNLASAFDKKMDWQEKLFWLEVSNAEKDSLQYYTDNFAMGLKGYSLNNFAAKKELAQQGEKLGNQIAEALILKYGF